VVNKVHERERIGKKFTLIVVAEGASLRGGHQSIQSQEEGREQRFGGVGLLVADEIGRRTGKETRVVVLGHLQRGGAPTSFDRLLCTRYGEAAVRLIRAGKYDTMVSLRGTEIVDVPIAGRWGGCGASIPTARWSWRPRRWESGSGTDPGFSPVGVRKASVAKKGVTGRAIVCLFCRQGILEVRWINPAATRKSRASRS